MLLVPCLAPAQVRVCGQQVPVYKIAGIEYVSLARLVQACNGRFWRVSDAEPAGAAPRFVAVMPRDAAVGPAGSASARPEREYVFWVDSTTVRCAAGGPTDSASGQEIHLPLAPKLQADQLYIPVLALAAILPDFSPTMPQLGLLGVFDAGDTAVVKLEVRSADGRRLTADGSLAWHGEARSGFEYQLAVGAQCDSQAGEQFGLIPILASNGLVQSVRLERAAGTVVRFTFRKPANVQAVLDAGGLTLKFWPKPLRRVRRIVLDPGHGGEDPGALGVAGNLEKAVALDVSLRLKARLEADGLEVLLTRTGDELVTLSNRSKFANSKRADLFVSVHANAAPNRQACGFETYFLSESKTDWERTVAARENAALEFENTEPSTLSDELELILTDLAQNEYLHESSELAARIQESTVPLARVNDRGVRQANFYVLRNNYMPAVLVECGFLTNRSEEKLLIDPKHRERLAEGIARGIAEFVRQYEKRANGS